MTPLPSYALSLLTPADYRMVPWKNGLGMTTEIAIHPAGATVEREDFEWRISRASVAADGPFSRYQDFDRTLVVLNGKGLDLYSGDKKLKALRPFDPYSFDGALKIHARLMEGAVDDFNVIARKRRARADVRVHRMNPNAEEWSFLAGDIHLFYAACGNVEAIYNRTGETCRLEEGCALLLDGRGREQSLGAEYVSLRPRGAEAVIIGVGVATQ